MSVSYIDAREMVDHVQKYNRDELFKTLSAKFFQLTGVKPISLGFEALKDNVGLYAFRFGVEPWFDVKDLSDAFEKAGGHDAMKAFLPQGMRAEIKHQTPIFMPYNARVDCK